jgi:hypothetical protein
MIRQLRYKSVAMIAALALSAVALAPATASAQTARPVTIPVVGTVIGGGGGTFSGALTIARFVNDNGTLTATGVVTGIVTNAVTGATTTVVSTFATPVTIAQATCSILHLDLGPLHLNVLGLQIDLSRIVLDITGQTGAGNLLGNLLCGIAGLLDPGGLARLLNQILGVLGGL